MPKKLPPPPLPQEGPTRWYCVRWADTGQWEVRSKTEKKYREAADPTKPWRSRNRWRRVAFYHVAWMAPDPGADSPFIAETKIVEAETQEEALKCLENSASASS